MFLKVLHTINTTHYEKNVFRVYFSILRQLSAVCLTQPIAGTQGDNLVWSGKLTKEIEENMIRKDENLGKSLIKAWLAPDVECVGQWAEDDVTGAWV